MTIRVLIVDDQPMYRAGLTAILGDEADIVVVGDAGNGEEALARNRVLHPDVVLMDVRMPKMNGIDATRELARPTGAANVPRVIMLTTFDIDEYVHAALRAGASGFLLKDALPDEVARAVRVVAAGEALLAPSVTRRLIEQVARTAPAPVVDEHLLASLTGREREVLELVARGRANQEIASDLFIAEQTVKTHVSKILQKLALRDRVHAVVFAYDAGLVRPGE
jgi:DNA-binding NarL/FixJ family response regulator